MDNSTAVERRSERELVLTRIFDAPPRLVFEAWTRPELMKLWWAPKSMGVPLISCDMDVRVGGGYRLEFQVDDSKTMAFYGKYIEVMPPSRLVWTNDEGEDGSITTVTFEESDGKTLLVLHELYPSKEALDQAVSGMADGMTEQFQQLDDLLASRTADSAHPG